MISLGNIGHEGGKVLLGNVGDEAGKVPFLLYFWLCVHVCAWVRAC